jgi:hypothetical protein
MEVRAFGNDVGNIVPFENIPADQLSKHYDDLANQHLKTLEQLQAIKCLYESAVKENVDLHEALEENIKVDEQFVDGVQGALRAAKKEKALLEMKITHLEYQELESNKASEENVKSLQERIFELEKENKRFKAMGTIQEKAIDTLEKVTQEVNDNPGPSSIGWSAIYFAAHCSSYYNPRWNILTNQVKETRQQQLELIKSQIEDNPPDQNIKL